MHIRELNGKTICILGFGKEGQSAFRALRTYAPDCEITIADRDAGVQAPAEKCWLQVGTGWLKNLDKFDVLIKSPGIPPGPELQALGASLVTGTQIFLDTVAEDGATVIGITGSKGKSTTSSLIHGILTAAGRDACLVGNIGSPALDALARSSSDVVFVLEMSSYQLMNLKRSPHIAVITSFFPEHLDYHGDVGAYREAKANIARHQTEEDMLVFNALSPEARTIAEESPGKKIPFRPEDAPVRIEETHLLGTHNLGNIAAAWKVAEELGLPRAVCVDVFRNFRGLPHRLQSLGAIGGAEWIDDSISTTPESAVAALDALGDRVAVLLLGGQDRGYDFSPLAARLKRSKVRAVILFPGSGPRIKQALEKAGTSLRIFEATDMEKAVAYAKQSLLPPTTYNLPPIVLLSPASPSYGMFKNFEDRGNQFRSSIERN